MRGGLGAQLTVRQEAVEKRALLVRGARVAISKEVTALLAVGRCA